MEPEADDERLFMLRPNSHGGDPTPVTQSLAVLKHLYD